MLRTDGFLGKVLEDLIVKICQVLKVEGVGLNKRDILQVISLDVLFFLYIQTLFERFPVQAAIIEHFTKTTWVDCILGGH